MMTGYSGGHRGHVSGATSRMNRFTFTEVQLTVTASHVSVPASWLSRIPSNITNGWPQASPVATDTDWKSCLSACLSALSRIGKHYQKYFDVLLIGCPSIFPCVVFHPISSNRRLLVCSNHLSDHAPVSSFFSLTRMGGHNIRTSSGMAVVELATKRWQRLQRL